MHLNNQSFREVLKIGRKFYKTLKRIWCPTLNDYIYFTKSGLGHLMRKGKAFRPKSEQRRRLHLLCYVSEILMDPDVQHSEKINQVRGKSIRYWIFTKTIDGIKVTVVIRENPDNRKRFLSIYGKKQKSTL